MRAVRSSLDKTADEIRKESGVKVLVTAADITKSEQVDGSAATVKDGFGTVHIVVNNAGGPMRRMDRQILWPDSDWIADLDNKILGALRVTRAFLPLMPGDGTGRIINISGTASTIVWAPALTHGLNNAAMNQATGYLAVDLASQQITVNTIVPGLVGTEGREVWAENMAKQQNVTKEAFVSSFCKRMGILAGRWATMDEVADAVAVPRLRSCALFQRVEDHSRRRFERQRTTCVIADDTSARRDLRTHEFRTAPTFL